MVAVNLIDCQGCRGNGCIHLACLDRCQSGILAHENYNHILNGRNFAVVVLVGFHDDLLLAAPLHKLIGAGSNSGICAVSIRISMLGNNAHRRQGIQKPEGRRVQGDHNREIVGGNSAVHEGQVNGSHSSLGSLQGKSYVVGIDLLTVGEISILTDLEGPDQAVFRQGVVGSQIVDKIHVSIVANQGALHNGSIAVAPAVGGIQGGGFVTDGNHNGISGTC